MYTLPLLHSRAVESAPDVVITEVMANALEEDSDEFIELYNASGASVDLAEWQFTDGDALDTLIAWDVSEHGELTDSDAVVGITELAVGAYAVVLDSEYAGGTQPYDMPAGTLVLTTQNTTLGNALTTTDPVTLFDPSAVVASTFGTPVPAEDWRDRDDDGLDAIPFNPGDGISVERIDVRAEDAESNWQASFAEAGHTVGDASSEMPPEEPPEEEPEQDDPETEEPNKPDSPSDPETPEYETGNVVLSELLPNPKGSDATQEWIELYNKEKASVDLAGWVVADGAREYVIGAKEEATTIKTGGYYVIDRETSGIALNNSTNEVVSLVDPFGKTTDEIDYAKAPEGESFALLDEAWEWTSVVTKGKKNVSSEEPDRETINDEDDEPETQDELEPEYDFSDNIRISELLPNPSGSDEAEWIELENVGGDSVDLMGWTLTDSKTYYRFAESTVIAAQDFVVVKRADSRIALNNSGDQVFLINPAQEILEGVAYEKSFEGQSFARGTDGSWHWTDDVTLGSENHIETTEDGSNASEEPVRHENPEQGAQTVAGAQVVTVAQALAAESNKRLVVEGVVTAAPGVVSEQIAYVQDGSSGIQVYSHSKVFPELSAGDRVRVTGTRSVANGEPRLKIKESKDVVVIGQGEVSPLDISDAQDLSAVVGQYVRFNGSVVETVKTRFVVQAGSAGIELDPGDAPLNVGDAIEAYGVVTRSRSGAYVAATSIQQQAAAETSETATVNSTGTDSGVLGEATVEKSGFTSSWWTYLILPALMISGFVAYQQYRRKREAVLLE